MSSGICPSCASPVDAQSGVCAACATQVLTAGSRASSDRAAPGSEALPSFRGYRVLRQLGRGGMGAVYLAEEEVLGRNVAIKVVSGSISGDAQAGARFLREARTLATIEHPHVVRVYSFGEHDGAAFLVMEYVEGETLLDRLARLGRFPLEEALRITSQIVDALEAAWQRRIVHRDIKPSNILLDSRDQVRVVDFGLAKPLDAMSDLQATQSGYLLGTPHYLSPEQAQGEPVDFRADVYALGIMLYQMLTGERPFEGTTPVAIVAKHLHEPLPSLRARRPDVPTAVEALVGWMTAKRIESRPGSYAELRNAIASIGNEASDAVTWIAARPQKPNRAQGLVLFALLAAFVASMIFAPRRRSVAPSGTAKDDRLVVAIAPFYGPDPESAKEGRVMVALIEREVHRRIGSRNARVIGIDEIGAPVRDHDAARQLGTKLQANAVIWGEAYALRNETEIEPHVTIVELGRPRESEAPEERGGRDRFDDFGAAARGSGPLKLSSEAPNQIELRKTSAAGVGDVVSLLAAIHALEAKGDAPRALALLENVPPTAETLRYQGRALLESGRNEEARAKLEESLRIDPSHAPTLATLADIELTHRRFAQAFALFVRAEQTGQPFTASRGFAQRGRLYVAETYDTPMREVATIYLLELEPSSGRTLARFSLPGELLRFARDGDVVNMTHSTRGHRTATLVMRENAFDRYLWPPVDLGARARSLRAGHILPANFLAAFAGPPSGTQPATLRLVARPDASLPMTPEDLEQRLREAIANDPTQPWHRFFRALTLRHLHRVDEAERELATLLKTDYRGTHYYEFAWMMSFLERMNLTQWENALFEKALARRRSMPVPVGAGTLTERIANAPFTRVAASRGNPERGWTLLDQARQLAGLSLDTDDVVAASWASYFGERGDERRRAHEQQIVRSMRAQRLNYLGAMMRLDYAFVFVAASIATLLLSLIVFAVVAIARVRRAGEAPAPRIAHLGERVAATLHRLPRLGALVLTTVIVGIIVALGALATVRGAVDGVWFFLLLFVIGVAYALHLLHARPFSVAAALQPRERRVLLAAFAAAIVAMLCFLVARATLGPLAAIPIGLADSIGHPDVAASFEGDLQFAPTEARRYATAVIQHYAGNDERAQALYEMVPQDARAARNLEALRRGVLPVVPLTLNDIADARLPRASLGFAALRGALSSPSLAALIVPLLGVVLLLLWAVPADPRYAAGAPRIGRTDRAAMLLVPGLYDIRRGNALLGFLTLFAVLFALSPAYMLLFAESPIAASPFGAIALPKNFATQPLPPAGLAGLAVRLAFPFAHLFWGAFAVAVILVLLVHSSRIRAILRS